MLLSDNVPNVVVRYRVGLLIVYIVSSLLVSLVAGFPLARSESKAQIAIYGASHSTFNDALTTRQIADNGVSVSKPDPVRHPAQLSLAESFASATLQIRWLSLYQGDATDNFLDFSCTPQGRAPPLLSQALPQTT